MLRVALTGGVGSGKSAAAAMLHQMGAYVASSDDVGRAWMQPGQPAYVAIVEHFGKGVVAADGLLDRAALARIAFNEGRVDELNAIVHPLVIAQQAAWAKQIAARDPYAVTVVESALVFETKYAATTEDASPWRVRFDRIVVVVAPLALRRQRYIARLTAQDEASAGADFDRRCAAQWSDEQKAALADFVVENDGSLDDLRTKMETVWKQLKAESAKNASEIL